MSIIAATPPMGWNSWDCYGASVTEEEVRANADYMAKHLKPYGWEYIVVDIQWYEPGADSSRYRPFVPLEMDDYSRLIPAVNRFPSAEGGKGFKPLADYVHSLGLKFGIHTMRGIPRQAVHANTSILGTSASAREIAHTNSICPWNTDMYGVNPTKEGSQAYYDSLFRLYAEWGVDFVKVDDIAASRLYDTHLKEIELIRKAIDKCGRDIVLSLSPGPAPISYAEEFKMNSNMWRMTDDYWDHWKLLYDMFERCEKWYMHVGPGHWPDCDMLPLGHIGIRSVDGGGADRWTRFTRDEQMTMMTLWCIFRSPLMFGGELRDNDDWTLSLLTNREVLRVLTHSRRNRPLYRNGEHIAWTAEDVDGGTYLAVFNTGSEESVIRTSLSELGLTGTHPVRDVWQGQEIGLADDTVVLAVPGHGARLVKVTESGPAAPKDPEYRVPEIAIEPPIAFDSNEYREMIAKSLLSMGNNRRLKAAIDKAKRGEDVTIAYIGGSITQGAGAKPIHTNCYAYKSYKLFKEMFGKEDGSNIHFIKAGVGGTPSELGIVRYNRDILRDGAVYPDVVIVEFAVNDAGDETKGKCYESLVVNILSAANKPAVILLFSVFVNDWNLQDRLAPVGWYYNLPMVSVKDAVVEQFRLAKAEGNVISKRQFFYDIYHPTNDGHTIMADCLGYLFAETDQSMENPDDVIIDKTPVIGNEFAGMRLLDRSNAEGIARIEAGGFLETDSELQMVEMDDHPYGSPEFPYNWMHTAESGNESFRMTMRSKSLILVFKDSGSSEFGKAEIWADGRLAKAADPHEVNWTHCNAVILYQEEVSKEHQVEIKMASGHENKRFTILGFGYIT